jgi:hypothetical protein
MRFGQWPGKVCVTEKGPGVALTNVKLTQIVTDLLHWQYRGKT